MGFLDKAKAAAEQATAKAKEGVGDITTKRELGQAYAELGKVAYGVAKRGELSHAEIDPLVARISELESKAGAEADSSSANGSAEAAGSGEQ
jgi:uncharacterized protein YjbJ (UPF0337 family)